MAKPIDSLKTIARYIEAKKPKTLDEAEHMLDLISVIADETIVEASVDDGAVDTGANSQSYRQRLVQNVRQALSHLI